MKQLIFSLFVFSLLVSSCPAGLFVGVAVVKKGLVVLEPSESGQGPGRVKERVRVELGDVVRVGPDGDCQLLVYEGTVVHLPPDGDYRITRDGLFKMLDGGNVMIVPFKVKLGMKTQRLPLRENKTPLGTIIPRGRVFLKEAASPTWAPMAGSQQFFAGDVVRCDKGVEATIKFGNGLIVRMEAGTLAYLLADSISVERGGGIVSLPDKGAPKYYFAASMTALRPQRSGTVFRFFESKDGCHLHVIKGAVKMALKAQGLPSRKTVPAGLNTRLTRAGTIEKPQVFINKIQLANLATKVNGALSADGPLNISTIFSPVKKVPTPPRPAPTVAPPVAAPKPPAMVKPPQPPRPPMATKKPVGPIPGSDLEDLFQLPRLGKPQLP